MDQQLISDTKVGEHFSNFNSIINLAMRFDSGTFRHHYVYGILIIEPEPYE